VPSTERLTADRRKKNRGGEEAEEKTMTLFSLLNKTFPKRLALKAFVCYNYNDKVYKHNRKGRDT
jgi:hypothetical protein